MSCRRCREAREAARRAARAAGRGDAAGVLAEAQRLTAAVLRGYLRMAEERSNGK